MNKKYIILIICCIAVTSGMVLMFKNNSAKSDYGTVEFYTDKGSSNILPAFEEVSKAMEEDGVASFTVVPYTDLATYKTTIQQTLQIEGEAPELFTWWVGEEMNTLVENELVVDLTQEWEDYYIPAGVDPALAEACTVDGKIYCAPFLVNYNGVFYNKEVFEEYGLEIPTTLEEFENVCDVLVANGVTPIAYEDVPFFSFYWIEEIMNAIDPTMFDKIVSGEMSYTDPQMYEVMETYIDWINKGYFSEPIQDMSAFADGSNAMILEPTWKAFDLVNLYGMSDSQFGIFPMPTASGEPGNIYYEVAPIFVSANSDNVEGAKEVLRNYYNPEYQQFFVDIAGITATTTTTVDNSAINDYMDMINSGEYSTTVRYYEAENPAVVEVANTVFQEVYYNPTYETIDNGLKTIQAKKDEVSATNE